MNSTYNNTKAAEVVKTFMEDNDFSDVWRERNPDEKRYTCYGRRLATASRIDLLLMDRGLTQHVKDVQIQGHCRSNHSLVQAFIADELSKRGPGV